MQNQIKFNTNNMFAHAIGEKEGATDKNIKADANLINAAFLDVYSNKGKGWQEWCNLPSVPKTQIEQLTSFGALIRSKCDSLVVLGIGGSALGPLAVANALLHLRHNELTSNVRKAPKLYVEDNIDPERMAALLDVIDINTSYFNVITKSGETSETLSQFLILYNILKQKLGSEKAKERIIVTTTLGKGTLYNIAVAEGFKIFGVGTGVGGRFSVLSNVGLVPFAILGIDIAALLKGASDFTVKCDNPDIYANPALLTAYLQYFNILKGKNISVLMPYADSLKYMADFYCQLWGESLGKAVDKSGKTVNVGQTPVKSLGVTDQHSQVQLYTEGPFDKVTTFLAVENFRNSVKIPQDDSIKAADFLKNSTLETLLNAERVATEFALTKASRANFTIYFNKVDAYSVGQLLCYFMYQTAFTGALLNIDTFNQPGVEEGKLATFAMLGRKGYENKLAEIKAVKNDNKYIL